MNECIDCSVAAQFVALSASRALGVLIAKCTSVGGMPYDVFAKLYDIMVCPVMSYGAAVWGDKTYFCINAVQNRATNSKYTPKAAVPGNIGGHGLLRGNLISIDLLQ